MDYVVAIHSGIVPFKRCGNAHDYNTLIQQRVQFRLEVYETDDGHNGGLVGRVVHNISLQVGEESDVIHFRYPQWDRSSVMLSFKVLCAENYYGQNCSRFCNESCMCDQGFTGEFCHKTNDCLGVNCGKNRQCLDKEDQNYTCVCNPGYTGEECDVKINKCVTMNINCSGHGHCVSGETNHSCVCDSGFTGTSCNESMTKLVHECNSAPMYID